MQSEGPKVASCRNCLKVADHIRTWTFHVTSGDRTKFWYEEDIGAWQNYLDAHDCSNCAKLVRLFSRPFSSQEFAGSTIQCASSISNEVAALGEVDRMQFCGDMKFNSFELRRVCEVPHSREDPAHAIPEQYLVI
jgi:hypothetical protein